LGLKHPPPLDDLAHWTRRAGIGWWLWDCWSLL
jgi:hypothetical protein